MKRPCYDSSFTSLPRARWENVVLLALMLLVLGAMFALSGCGWRCAPAPMVSLDPTGRPVLTGGKIQCTHPLP